MSYQKNTNSKAYGHVYESFWLILMKCSKMNTKLVIKRLGFFSLTPVTDLFGKSLSTKI